MANVNPSYDSVKYSGVSSNETPGNPGNTYAEADASGVAFPNQDDYAAPPVPENTSPDSPVPYNQIKN